MFHLPVRTQGLNDPKNAAGEGVNRSGIQVEQVRRELSAQRAEAERQRKHDDHQCFQRLVVNDCRADVRARYRPVFADLKRQELLLNDMERRDKGLQRLRQLDDKAARAPQYAESAPEHPVPQIREEKPARPSRKSTATPAKERFNQPDAQRQAEATARWRARQEQAKERREKAKERQSKRKSASLPPPD